MTLVMLNLQRESFGGEQILQFIEQANNHHASDVKSKKGISEKNIFIQDIIVFKGIEY